MRTGLRGGDLGWKLVVGGVTGLAAVAIGLFAASEAIKARDDRARWAAEAEAERTEASGFAACVASKLNDEGLARLVVYRYRPLGLLELQQSTIRPSEVQVVNARYGGRVWADWSPAGVGLDWEPFEELRRRCALERRGPFSEAWRFAFWSAMEEQAAFQQARASSKSRDDAILKPFREAISQYEDERAKDQQRSAEALLKAPHSADRVPATR